MVEPRKRRKKSSSTVFLTTSLLTVAAITIPSAAHAQSGAVYGGSAGRYFEDSCGPGRVLVGLRGSAGVLLDSIQIVCAGVDGRNVTINANAQGPVIGNDRPFDQSIECPVGYAVTSASMARNESYPHLGAIRLFCTELARRDDGGMADIQIRGSGHLEGYDSPNFLLPAHEGNLVGSSECPGQYATGIRGRDGGYVTAFGLLCGPKPVSVPDPNAGHTLGKRKRQSATLVDDRASSEPAVHNLPEAGVEPTHTLGKRKRRGPSETGSTQMGASIFTDSSGPAMASETDKEPPSPLINGTYLTTLAISESHCFQDLRSTHQGIVQIKPQPAITIPINEMNSIFGGPVILSVEGLRLAQSTTIPINAGPVGGPVPANFDGMFTEDASRFDVRFEAGNALCRIRGTISGIKKLEL